MDEFDIYLEDAGSMNIHSGNTRVAFPKPLAHPIPLECDLWLALAEIIFPTSIKNITTTDLFFHTPKTSYNNTPVLSAEAGAVIKREDTNLKLAVSDTQQPFGAARQSNSNQKANKSADFVKDSVEISFESKYGISVRDRSLFDVLGIQGLPDTNRGDYYE